MGGGKYLMFCMTQAVISNAIFFCTRQSCSKLISFAWPSVCVLISHSFQHRAVLSSGEDILLGVHSGPSSIDVAGKKAPGVRVARRRYQRVKNRDLKRERKNSKRRGMLREELRENKDLLERGFEKVKRGEVGLGRVLEMLLGEYSGRDMEEVRELYEEWKEKEKEEEKEKGSEVLSKEEVEKYLSRMGRGEGVSGKDQLQALSLYIRMKGWGNGKEEEGEELGGEISELLKR